MPLDEVGPPCRRIRLITSSCTSSLSTSSSSSCNAPLTLTPTPPWSHPRLPTTSDQFFGNVCELDLVFNFNKVYMILDEFFLAGEVQETSKQAILHRVQELDKAE